MACRHSLPASPTLAKVGATLCLASFTLALVEVIISIAHMSGLFRVPEHQHVPCFAWSAADITAPRALH